MTLQPVVQDQYVAARLYFGAVVGLFFIEGLFRLGVYLRARSFKPSSSQYPLPDYNGLTV